MSYPEIAGAAPAVFRRNRLRMSPVNDPQAMIALVAASSEQSRFLRFHTGMPTLRPPMAEQLADISPPRGKALGLWTSRKRLVAEARYIRLSDDLAEVAILIADAYQGRGLGVALLADIYQRAADDGSAALHGEVLSSNDAMVHG
jgi:acetyltransferase